jgi:hypothetical protein
MTLKPKKIKGEQVTVGPKTQLKQVLGSGSGVNSNQKKPLTSATSI